SPPDPHPLFGRTPVAAAVPTARPPATAPTASATHGGTGPPARMPSRGEPRPRCGRASRVGRFRRSARPGWAVDPGPTGRRRGSDQHLVHRGLHGRGGLVRLPDDRGGLAHLPPEPRRRPQGPAV